MERLRLSKEGLGLSSEDCVAFGDCFFAVVLAFGASAIQCTKLMNWTEGTETDQEGTETGLMHLRNPEGLN
eukprot:gene9706-biopygen7990